METIALKSIKRTGEEKMSDLRDDKKIPAVIYGKKTDPVSIQLEYSDFLKVFRVSGKSNIIKLSIDKKSHDVLVHDIQLHPITGDYQHVDFLVIDAKEKMTVPIPVVLVGTSPAQMEGGLVAQKLHEIEVKCFASDLVDHFEFDISSLKNLGDVAHVADLVIDTEKYELVTPERVTIVSILEPRVAKVEDEVVHVEGEAAEGGEATDSEEAIEE